MAKSNRGDNDATIEERLREEAEGAREWDEYSTAVLLDEAADVIETMRAALEQIKACAVGDMDVMDQQHVRIMAIMGLRSGRPGRILKELPPEG